MAKKLTKLFPTPVNSQIDCLPGKSSPALRWFGVLAGLINALPEGDRQTATIYITAERGVEVWYSRTVSDAEVNQEQEMHLLNALLQTPIKDMNEDWRTAVIEGYHRIEVGDPGPAQGV